MLALAVRILEVSNDLNRCERIRGRCGKKAAPYRGAYDSSPGAGSRIGGCRSLINIIAIIYWHYPIRRRNQDLMF